MGDSTLPRIIRGLAKWSVFPPWLLAMPELIFVSSPHDTLQTGGVVEMSVFGSMYQRFCAAADF